MSILLQAEVSTASAASALRESPDDLADFLSELAGEDDTAEDITDLGRRIAETYSRVRAAKVFTYLRSLANAIDEGSA